MTEPWQFLKVLLWVSALDVVAEPQLRRGTERDSCSWMSPRPVWMRPRRA